MIEGGMGKMVSNRYEHLKSGIKPIMACIGDREEHREVFEALIDGYYIDPEKTVYVNYFEDAEELDKKGFKNGSDHTYVMSHIDNQDKFSKGYVNCTGVIVTGQDKDTNNNISFLTHQNSSVFTREELKTKFINDLSTQLIELKQRSLEKSIDVVIVGGYYSSSDLHQDYVESIKTVDEIVFNELGFHPNVVVGPKTILDADNVFYDNKNRKVYIGRRYISEVPATIDFNAQEIEESKKNDWEFPAKKDL